MIIATSSWFQRLDTTKFQRIGISRGVPRGQRGFKRYRPLEPGPWFRSVDDEEYRRRYYQILDGLDPATVVAELEAMAEGRIAVLLCFEDPKPGGTPCHRAIVSEWLEATIGLQVPELGFEHCGCGSRHPKLARPAPRDLFTD